MTTDPAQSPARVRVDLFLVSLLILFLELACIRWFPSHVLFLTFFTNVVLLACFLGMSVGCLAAGRPTRYLNYTPILLGVAVVLGSGMELVRGPLSRVLDAGNQSSPQLVFFGTEYSASDLASFFVPIEVVGGLFFLLLALTFVGPGQELGRALSREPNRVLAYTINILGSVIGIVLFAAMSWLQLPPLWWFLPAIAVIAYLLRPQPWTRGEVREWALRLVVLGVSLAVMILPGGLHFRKGVTQYWSPYYRIDYSGDINFIEVNLIGHQQMVKRDDPFPAYALPHLLNRDSGRPAFKDVMVIGAGSGNDLARALQWGAESIDAVEIDPVIQRLGAADHPNQPYSDERVHLHLDDGRNFLRAGDKQYDLIVYALVDSLVLHSSYSNIRLESYLFTEQAFRDIKRRLKPGGMFVMYNYFRQGWIVARLHQALSKVFDAEPLVLTLPYLKEVKPEESFAGFTVFLSGPEETLEPVREAFAKEPEYWLSASAGPSPEKTPNGFTTPPAEMRKQGQKSTLAEAASGAKGPAWLQFGLAKIIPPQEELRPATDDWPFLYLRSPLIPTRPTLTGMLVMALIAAGMIFYFLPRSEGGRTTFDLRMFFLGAGFMLVETKAVVHMALLFGSTWMVNSVVFFAVLVMILLANLFVLRFRPQRLWPFYVGLFVALAANLLVPLDFFLGLDRWMQIALACMLVFAPILFAGVIFATAFGRTVEADRAFGANIAGSMVGGLAENTSMLLGFQYLMLVAMAFYGLSTLGGRTKSGGS